MVLKLRFPTLFQKREFDQFASPSVDMYYTLDFDTAICGHHLYKEKWTPISGEKLSCVKDTRTEAAEYDHNAIGVYLKVKEGEESGSVEHVPFEILKLMNQFLQANSGNRLTATFIGKRKREVGLIVPAKYVAMTSIKNDELRKIMEKYRHFEISLNLMLREKRKHFLSKAIFFPVYSNKHLLWYRKEIQFSTPWRLFERGAY